MNKLRSFLNSHLNQADFGPTETLNRLLLFSSAFAVFLLFAFFYDVFILESGEVVVFAAYLAMAPMVWGLAAAKRLPHVWRANGFLLLVLLVGLVDVIVVAGQHGETQLFMLILPVLSLTLLGLRTGVVYSAIALIVIIGTGFLETRGFIPLSTGYLELLVSGSNWATLVLNFGLLSLVLLMILQRLLDHNQAILLEELQAVKNLEREQEMLEQLVGQRLKVIEAVNELSQRLTRILDKETLLKTAVSLVRQTLDFHFVGLYEKHDDQFLLNHYASLDGKVLAGEQVARQALEDSALVFEPSLDSVADDVESMAAVPLHVNDENFAVLVYALPRGSRFTLYDRYYLETIASEITEAWRNAMIYAQAEQQAQYETLLGLIGEKIEQTTSVDEAVKTAVRELKTHLPTSRIAMQVGLEKVRPS